MCIYKNYRAVSYRTVGMCWMRYDYKWYRTVKIVSFGFDWFGLCHTERFILASTDNVLMEASSLASGLVFSVAVRFVRPCLLLFLSSVPW